MISCVGTVADMVNLTVPLIGLELTVANRSFALGQRFTNGYRITVPGMPGIANRSRFGIMGVGLLSCITGGEHIYHWRWMRLIRDRFKVQK